MKAPGIIIISDGLPSGNMAGISQTLFNLFDKYAGPLWMLMPEQESIPPEPRLKMKVLRYRSSPFAPVENRLGRWLNPKLLRLQLSHRQCKWLSPIDMPAPSAALVLVSTTDSSKLQVAWILEKKGYVTIPYFMDDWLSGNGLSWRGNSIQAIAKELLEKAPAWLMISRQLAEILENRYQLQRKPTLVIHNPAPEIVDQSGAAADRKADVILPGPGDALQFSAGIADHKSQITGHRFKIIYAGSIWPMHADALVAVAKAVHLLHAKGRGQYCMDLYVPEPQWIKYRALLQGAGVYYRGWLSASEIQSRFEEGWLLLCTASFEPAHRAFSISSVQTKLTNYMAAGKPLLFVGPAESASGDFVEELDCGFTIGTINYLDIAAQIEAIASLPAQYERKGGNGLAAAKDHFSQKKVQARLYHFLENISRVLKARSESLCD